MLIKQLCGQINEIILYNIHLKPFIRGYYPKDFNFYFKYDFFYFYSICILLINKQQ